MPVGTETDRLPGRLSLLAQVTEAFSCPGSQMADEALVPPRPCAHPAQSAVGINVQRGADILSVRTLLSTPLSSPRKGATILGREPTSRAAGSSSAQCDTLRVESAPALPRSPLRLGTARPCARFLISRSDRMATRVSVLHVYADCFPFIPASIVNAPGKESGNQPN